MRGISLRKYLLMIIVVKASEHVANACTELGWFGRDCSYMCHCMHQDVCNPYTGACPNNKCAKGWFGPACQYASQEFFAQSMGPALNWLNDGDETTCNDGMVDVVNLDMKNDLRLTWLRLVVSETVTLDEIYIQYMSATTGDIVQCKGDQFAKIKGNSVDIACPTTDLVKAVTVSGSAVRKLCAVHISGGRNIALRQKGIEYSKTEGATKFEKNAVDGNIGDGLFSSFMSTCVEVEGSVDEPAWWSLTLSREAQVDRIVIYNMWATESQRNPCCGDRLIGFRLKAFNEPGTEVFYYQSDWNLEAQRVYTIVPPSKISQPVKKVQILLPVNASENVLSFCEILVFGETSCPPGTYGRDCEFGCPCTNLATCFAGTGGCPSGCHPGYTGLTCTDLCPWGSYGRGCDMQCSSFCTSKLCHRQNGDCEDGCKIGYQPRQCKDVCPDGRYGQGCEQSCKETCTGPDGQRHCDPVHGYCVNTTAISEVQEASASANLVWIIVGVAIPVAFVIGLVLTKTFSSSNARKKQDADTDVSDKSMAVDEGTEV